MQLVAALGSSPIVSGAYVQFDPSAASVNKQTDQFDALIERSSTIWQQVLPNTKIISSIWFAQQPLDQNGLDLLAKTGVRSIVMLPKSSVALGEFDNAARPYRLESNDADISLHLVDKNYVDQLSTPAKNAFASATYLAAQILAQRSQIETEGGTPALRRVVLASRDGSVINEDLIHEALITFQVENLQKWNVPAADIKKAVDDLKETPQFSTVGLLYGILKSLLGSIFFGLILAAIFKKNKPVF